MLHRVYSCLIKYIVNCNQLIFEIFENVFEILLGVFLNKMILKAQCTPIQQLGILYGACAKFSAQSLGRGSEIQYGGV